MVVIHQEKGRLMSPIEMLRDLLNFLFWLPQELWPNCEKWLQGLLLLATMHYVSRSIGTSLHLNIYTFEGDYFVTLHQSWWILYDFVLYIMRFYKWSCIYFCGRCLQNKFSKRGMHGCAESLLYPASCFHDESCSLCIILISIICLFLILLDTKMYGLQHRSRV